MTEPTQPKDPPSEGASPASDSSGDAQNGVPGAAGEHEPKGMPTSDRQATETTPAT